MDNINDLIGDAAKQLMAQADGIQNQKLKASARRTRTARRENFV